MKKTLLKRHQEEVNGRIPASVYSSIRRSACVTVLMSSSGAVSQTLDGGVVLVIDTISPTLAGINMHSRLCADALIH